MSNGELNYLKNKALCVILPDIVNELLRTGVQVIDAEERTDLNTSTRHIKITLSKMDK